MRLLIIGASGVVGRLLCGELRKRSDWTLILAGRNLAPLRALAADFSPVASVLSCDLGRRDSLDSVLRQAQPDIVVNVAGNYTSSAMTVAEACLDARVMLIDICDEPKAMALLRTVHERAVAAGVPLVIGGGTAPQTSCALLRLVLERSGPGVQLRMGYVLGLNRYGPNAVQTVSRGVSGLMSHDQPEDLWSVGPLIPFPKPFGPLRIRRYPVPETILLENWPGVESWFAGARLIFGWLNAYIRLLQRLKLSNWGVTRFWNTIVSGICRAVYYTRCAPQGIAIGVEAERDGRCVRGQLYHPEMSQLTAHALAVSLDQFLVARPNPGVWWGHEVIDPLQFLKLMEGRGVVWSIDQKTSQTQNP